MLNQAKEFAKVAHGDQMYGKQRYTDHLDEVVGILRNFYYSHEDQAIGYLHDVIEDTDVTQEQLAREFNPFIAQCVAYLSDEKAINRKERKRLTNIKLKAIPEEYNVVLRVKAADRLANMQSCIDYKLWSMLEMYCREYPEFKHAVYRPNICDDIWVKLDTIYKYADDWRINADN